jgi:hypothetical protein
MLSTCLCRKSSQIEIDLLNGAECIGRKEVERPALFSLVCSFSLFSLGLYLEGVGVSYL